MKPVHSEIDFRELLKVTPYPMLVVDKTGNIHFANDAVCSLLGCNSQNLTGLCHFSLIEQPDQRAYQRFFEAFVEPSKSRSNSENIHVYICCDKEQALSVSINLQAFSSGRDRLIVVNVSHNTQCTKDETWVAKYYENNEALAEKSEAIENISSIAKIGFYKLNFATNQLTWSDQIYRIHELPIGSPIDVDMAVAFYADNAQPVIAEAVENSLRTGDAYDLELPFITAKKRRIWVRAVGYVEFENGTPKTLRGSFQDITKLRESLIQAEESLQAKSAFLTNMSHELRTPINGILGMAELLDIRLSDSKDKEYLAALQYSANWLLSLVNQVLSYAKSASLQDKLSETCIELAPFFNALCYSHKLMAEQKGLTFCFKQTESVPTNICVDATKLQQIVHNLLSNAVKFTESGSVTLVLDCIEKQHLHLVVRDTGIGIHKDAMASLFDAFIQADMSLTRKYQGTGLGLSIVKQLVDVMGGNIDVLSDLGKGTAVKIHLPIGLSKKNTVLTTQENESPNQHVEYVNKHIVVVEDNDINQVIVRDFLEREGMHVTLCSDGVEAIKYIKSAPEIDLVLMDCQMPNMDGYECTKQLKIICKQKYKNTPVVAVTAHAFDDEKQKCLAVGMVDVLTKPFTKQQLMTMLKQYLPD